MSQQHLSQESSGSSDMMIPPTQEKLNDHGNQLASKVSVFGLQLLMHQVVSVIHYVHLTAKHMHTRKQNDLQNYSKTQ
jgi:hypothetical protein